MCRRRRRGRSPLALLLPLLPSPPGGGGVLMVAGAESDVGSPYRNRRGYRFPVAPVLSTWKQKEDSLR
jgi:hypothetical protein